MSICRPESTIINQRDRPIVPRGSRPADLAPVLRYSLVDPSSRNNECLTVLSRAFDAFHLPPEGATPVGIPTLMLMVTWPGE